MTFKQYISLMTLGTTISVIAWVIVLVMIDPISTGIPGVIAFYVTLFASLVGSISLFGAMIRVLLIHPDRLVSGEVAKSFRHGFLLSTLILVSLLMSTFSYLRWWTMILLTLLFAILELFFHTSKQHK